MEGDFLLALEVNRGASILYVETVMCVMVREASLYHLVCFIIKFINGL